MQCNIYTPITLQVVFPTFIGVKKSLKIVKADILNYSKLPSVLTCEAGNLEFLKFTEICQ